MKPLLLAFSLLLPLALSLTLQEDDLVFDDVGEPATTGYGLPIFGADEHRREHDRKYETRSRENKKYNVERLWGIPDTSVVVGHVFKMRILKQAFSGNVDHFEARGINGQSLPHWLDWDEAASTLIGVPTKKDSGIHHVTIKAFGKHGDVAKDVFSINVVVEKKDEVVHKDGKMDLELEECVTHCDESEDQTLLTILLDARFENLKPAVRVNAIENLAGFLGLHTSAFSMHPHTGKETFSPDASVILSGPGNVKYRREKHSTAIQWQVGCDGRLWHHQTDLVRQLRDQAKDGTLAEVLQQPVLLWRVKTDSSSLLRNRRETGSGDFDENYDDYNYDDYDEENENENENENGEGGDDDETVTEQPIFKSNVEDIERPHRHHHGDKTIDPSIEDIDMDEILPINTRTFDSPVPAALPPIPLPPSTTTTTPPPTTETATVPPATVSSTTTTTTTTQVPTTIMTTISSTTIRATTTTSTTTAPTTTESANIDTVETPKEKIENIDTISISLPTVQPTTPPYTTTLQFSETNAISTSSTAIKSVSETTVVFNQTTPPQEPTTTPEPLTTPSTTMPSTTTTTTTSTTTTTTTPLPPPTTTPAPIPEITEKIEHRVLNFPPREERTLQKLQVTSGKPLSYVIPDDTFVDMEDGDARHLSLSLYWQNSIIKPDHWLQFNRKTLEVYGLPHENMISIWDYKLVAEDSEGARTNASLDVHVQQHKLSRALNHEFSIYLKIEKRNAFPTNVDWQLKVVRSIAKLYGDPTTDQITVRNIDISDDQAIFTWFNDSLPRDSKCPKEQIDKLFHVLVANERGDPSIALQEVLEPEIKVKRVIYQGIEQCENLNKPVTPSIVTQEPQENQPPVARNQVDHINATVGQLLVYTVPKDAFFDDEDGATRNMNLTLMTSTRSQILESDWLQFDSKNQQFYGVPLRKDIGRKEYQLIVTDKAGASITDALVVVVHPSITSPSKHNVEFSMTLEIPYNTFAHSAIQKRKFIENVAKLFHDRNTSAISLDSITENTVVNKKRTEYTIVTWHNKTLVTDYCPHEEITQLREVLGKDENMLTERVHHVMGPDFPVTQVTLTPTGFCGGEQTSVLSPSMIPPSGNTTSVGKSYDDLIITFIVPAIIIAAMLILAGIIACILYRRKRSGKMSVSEQDDERQSFRNKGIPVIFQDELDEKPDPGNKSPVILKEEKPPLPPPEYQKTEDGADVPMLQSENSEEPYQPPPPFATNRENNRQNRPKPTPTYRKPPPYVPP